MNYDRVGQFHTGLLVPEKRPLTTPRLRDVIPLLNRKEIEEIIRDPKRVAGRNLFGPKVIKHQGSRGSCNGYAGAKALQRSRVLQGMPHVELSGEGLYAQINDGRDRGSGLQEGMEALLKNGVPPEAMVPREEYLWSRITEEAKRACSRFRAAECHRADDEDELATGLALGFVGVVAVHANNAFMRLDGNGIVNPADGVGNHSVGVDDLTIIGGEYAFDMFNSWGLTYGDQGRGLLTWRRHFRTPSRHHAFYLIRAAHSDPEGINPPIPHGYDGPIDDDHKEDDSPPASDVTISMMTRDNCGYCRKWKQEVLPSVQQAGYGFQEQIAGGGVPRFTIFVGGRNESRTGFIDFAEVQSIVSRLRS
jgi:hypothetical protein